MKNLKKFLAFAIVGVMVFSFCGCHKKGETAIKVGNLKYSSAYYMCALIEADMNARQQIDNKAQSDSKIDTSKEGYYYKQKIDGKSFETYVKETALGIIKENAAYKIKCDEAKLKIKDNDEQMIKSYVSYYWTTGGYSVIYGENGVSEQTFTDYFRSNYYKQLYFDYLYGKEGKKAVSDDELSKYKSENYCLADVLTADLSNEEAAKKELTEAKLNDYEKDLVSGAKTFKQVYEEYNNVEEANKQESYSTVIGSSKTDSADDNFDTVKAMNNDEVKLIKSEDGNTIKIYVKRDLASDETQNNNLDDTVRHALKDEEFEKDIQKYIKTLKFEEIKSATRPFKIKKIKYPEQNNSASQPIA